MKKDEQVALLAAKAAARATRSGTIAPRRLPSEVEAFWEEKSLEDLAAEQGVLPVRRLEDLWGRARGLWADDEDFERFFSVAKGAGEDEA